MTSLPLGSKRYTPPGRGSISARIPIQRIIFTGSVKNWKTKEGGASMNISLTRRSAKVVPCLLFSFHLQLGQTILPELVEKSSDLRKTLCPEPIKPTSATSSFAQQPGVNKHSQMLRDSWPGSIEIISYLPRAQFPTSDELQYGHATRLGKSPEHRRGRLAGGAPLHLRKPPRER